jgi:hypothetical protein
MFNNWNSMISMRLQMTSAIQTEQWNLTQVPNKQIHLTRITNWWKLATKIDKTTENEVFWAHKMPWWFGEENLGRGYTRKEEERATKKERVQDITDTFQMSASNAGHLAYDKSSLQKSREQSCDRDMLLNERIYMWGLSGKKKQN